MLDHDALTRLCGPGMSAIYRYEGMIAVFMFIRLIHIYNLTQRLLQKYYIEVPQAFCMRNCILIIVSYVLFAGPGVRFGE